MLQSPDVGGRKELLTGLRLVRMPQDATSCVSALYVADYRPNLWLGQKQPPAPAAVVLEGRPAPGRPGWMLVVVTGETYRRNSRSFNEVTAVSTLREILPLLPEWLAKLSPADV